MNFSLFIAKKYFFSNKKKSFINFISIISMLGVGIGTMALVVVLSVFNGLEDLNRQIFKSHDPDLKITAKIGKTFVINPAKLKEIKKIAAINTLTEVIEDNALAKYSNAQMVVSIKGVDSTFEKQNQLKNSIVEGQFKLLEKTQSGGLIPYAVVGGGVYALLGINLESPLQNLELWYPRNQKTLSLNPEDNINSFRINVAGVFSLEQQYDNIIYLPLNVVQELTGYQNKRTALEIKLKTDNASAATQATLQAMMGNDFSVKNRDEQNASLFRAIKIEKMFIFVALLFIIGVASFNIFFSLMMLVIDKRDDVKTMFAMGAERSLIMRIFYFEGAIIAFSGASIGLIFGALLCTIQQKFGLVSMGMRSAIVDAYPVKMQVSDFVFTALSIIIITLLASYFPAKRASLSL